MTSLLFVAFFLIVFLLAPFKFSVVLGALAIAIPSIIRYFAHSIAGVDTSFNEAFKAVVLSLGLVVLAAFGLITASGGHIELHGMVIYATLAGLLLAYTFGFKIALGLPIKSSAVVAAASTAASAGITYAIVAIV